MEERFRIFFCYRATDLNFLNVHGMNMKTKELFSILLHSPEDRIDLTYNTSHLPGELLEVLHKEKEKIDSGYYDVRQWTCK
ncbi:hypothetical protein WD019_13260 [Fictibacillus sp. Mic-4]|uniref:hypothetical protein n=1 Tax=Fictibacillus TaxID=1329200 RepID=UPI00040E3B9B|nr:hypothetical protein [Fictibacillus gelatini]